MPPAKPTSNRLIQGRFAHSLLLTLLALALIPFILMGSGAYLQARSLLRAQASDLLSSVATTQGRRLVDTAGNGQLLLSRQLNQPSLVRAMADAMTVDPGSQSFTDLRSDILANLRDANDPKIYFTQFLVINPSGQIIVSSRSAWQGLTLSIPTFYLSQGRNFMQAGFARDFGLTPSGINAQPSYVWLTGIPATGEQSELVGYVVGVSESQLVKSWIQSAMFFATNQFFFDQSGNIVGVNPYANHIEKLVELEPSAEQRTLLKGFAAGVGADGDGEIVEARELTNAQGEPVLSAFTWMPELSTGWAVEIPQSQIYSQADALLIFAAGIFLIAFVLLSFIFWRAIQGLSRPLGSLTAAVQGFAAGDWSQRALVMRQDEFGELAVAFNKMADELTELYRSLRVRIAEATTEIRQNAELSELAISNPQLDAFLPQALQLLVERYDGTRAAISLAPGAGADAQAPGSYVVEDNKRPAASQIDVPLQINRQVLGELVIESSKPNRFGEKEQQAISDTANQLALVIQNAQLRRQAEADLFHTAERYQGQAKALQARLNELETLTAVSQAIAASAGSADLFGLIHQQVEHSLGRLDFLVALCDLAENTIEIPYMSENGEIGSIPPYPLGEGLTSIVIQSGRPLRLVEDTEQRANELGAKVLGRRARSWLGVPIRFGDESLGALVVQDSEHYQRFGPDEEALLVTLATQVSVFVRYLSLLENARRQAEQDRLLLDITNKIHRSVNLETILQTTVRELGGALGARRATIEILPGPAGD